MVAEGHDLIFFTTVDTARSIGVYTLLSVRGLDLGHEIKSLHAR